MKPFKPHPYQEDATAFLLRNTHAYGALPMGSGKTAIALTVMETAMTILGDCSRVLVVGPKRVAEMVWSTEAAKWEHLSQVTVAKCIGNAVERVKALGENAQITTIGRESFPWLVKHYGKKFPFDAVVWDEASGLKDPSSLRVRAMKAIRKRLKRLILLSGTPAPNSLLDLWPSYFLLDGGERLGKTLGAYREAYFEPDKRDKYRVYSWKLRPGAEEEIYRRISDITYRCDVDLGVREIYNDIPVAIPLREYRQLERDYLLPVKGGVITAANAAVLCNKLLQIAGGAIYDEAGSVRVLHDAKLTALEELIDASMGKPVLVLYWFKHELERLMARFPAAVRFDGEATMAQWKAGRIPLMFLHPGSAGHGVDGLQEGGAIAVWYSPTYSLELYQQANARLARQGQKETVIISHLVATGTIDSAVLAALQSKGDSQDRLLNALKERINDLP